MFIWEYILVGIIYIQKSIEKLYEKLRSAAIRSYSYRRLWLEQLYL